MQLKKGYMDDAAMRHKLNELTQKTFGFDFENWVTNGYYDGDYIPYSYETDEKLIANASVNRMVFIQNGIEKHYIQIGTVMTDTEFRNRGHASELIKFILSEYAAKCDGIYLFGNLNALEFYDKLGFARGVQYRYILKNEAIRDLQEKALARCQEECFNIINPNNLLDKNRYMEAVRNSAVNSSFEQINKFGLQMFYTADMDNVFYCKELDCYAVMAKNDDTLYLQSIISKERISLCELITYIHDDYSHMILGFTPCAEYVNSFDAQLYDGEDDYRLFYYGEQIKCIETDKLYFPELSHA